MRASSSDAGEDSEDSAVSLDVGTGAASTPLMLVSR